MSVAVVTDSTAYLPAAVVEKYGIEVVPLYVVLAGRSGREGSEIGPEDVARALSVRGQTVSTSRPTPGDFVAAYRRCLAAGAGRIVSIHLSAELSSTSDAARLAASQVGERLGHRRRLPVHGHGHGLRGHRGSPGGRPPEGADAATVAEVAGDTAAGETRTFFVVDTLERLRPAGRPDRVRRRASGDRPSRSSRSCTSGRGASCRWRRSGRPRGR